MSIVFLNDLLFAVRQRFVRLLREAFNAPHLVLRAMA